MLHRRVIDVSNNEPDVEIGDAASRARFRLPQPFRGERRGRGINLHDGLYNYRPEPDDAGRGKSTTT